MLKLKNNYFKDNIGILLFSVSFICILIRFFMLSNQSLWFDEGATLNLTDNLNLIDNITNLLTTKAGDHFQPLYYLIMPYWRFIFGNSEFALRSFSALLGSIAVILLSLVALRLFGKKHALWTLSLATFSAFGVFYSQDARPCALLTFCTALQIYFFTSAMLDKHDKVSRWGFWITTMIGLFGSIFICIFTAGLSITHFIIYRNRKNWLRWWLPTSLFALPSILFYFSSELIIDPTLIHTVHYGFPIIQNVLFVLYGILVGQTYGPSINSLHTYNRWTVVFNYLPELFILLVVGFIIAVLLVKIYTKKSENQLHNQFFFSLLLISFVLAFLFALVTNLNWLPRHSFYLWTPFVLLMPTICHSKNKSGSFAKGVFIILIILNIYSLYNYFFNESYRKDDYRAVAKYIISQSEPDNASVIVAGFRRLLVKYGDTKTLDCTGIKGKHLSKEISKLTQNSKTVLVIANNVFFWQTMEKTTVEKAMSELYVLDSTFQFPNMIVYHFNRKLPTINDF